MAAEVGQFALILALVLAMVQVATGLWGAHRGEPVLMALSRSAALMQAGFVILAFGCLAASYLACDFSVALVAEHSHSRQPWPYRLAATWGSHEGSMLLWVLILAIFGAGVAWFGGTLRETLQAEHTALGHYKKLLGLVAGRNVALEEYARSLIEQEEAHIDEIDKMLRKPGDVHMSKEAQDLH